MQAREDNHDHRRSPGRTDRQRPLRCVAGRRRCIGRALRSSTRSAARWPAPSEPCARIVARVTASERPVPGVRHRSARGTAGCGADQRHRVACARFRRLQRHAGRPSIGADPAGAVRARGDARGRRARRSSPPMSRVGRPRRASRAASISIITRRAGTRPRRSACSARPPRAAICWDWRRTRPRRRWDWRHRSRRASRRISAP